LRRIAWRESELGPVTTLVNRGPFSTKFGKLVVFLPPAAFLQPTEAGERALVGAVMAALPVTEGKRLAIADHFSGCGTFTGSLLEAGFVDAFESNISAVKALAKASDGRAVRVYKRDLFRQPLKRDELNRYDVVVMDPPRAGCPEQAQKLASSKVGTIIGVSCNAATFARDARTLLDGGYRIESLQVFDQFQWSHHAEVVGVFRKGTGRH
jgi:23S rRNA (uracil1939-C5)-methyltransferase